MGALRREWAPAAFCVGFKLETDEAILVAKAAASIRHYGLHFGLAYQLVEGSGGVGTFRGGIQQFGLAEQGVGYVYDANNAALIPDAVRARLDALTADIIAGRILVPSTR